MEDNEVIERLGLSILKDKEKQKEIVEVFKHKIVGYDQADDEKIKKYARAFRVFLHRSLGATLRYNMELHEAGLGG